jgi:hypothetical protein
MANNKRGHWTHHVGALRDVAPKGSFESVRHGPQGLDLQDGGLDRN